MELISRSNFGPLIAYIVPGVTALWGIRPYAPFVETLFVPMAGVTPTVGGFLYLTVSALAMGMTLSAVRWAVIDTLHAQTGLPVPKFDFSKLGRNVAAYETLNQIHYQHYLFYGNMTLACAVGYIGHRLSFGRCSFEWSDVVFVFMEAIFIVASRDTLRKYYVRVARLLGVLR